MKYGQDNNPIKVFKKVRYFKVSYYEDRVLVKIGGDSFYRKTTVRQSC